MKRHMTLPRWHYWKLGDNLVVAGGNLNYPVLVFVAQTSAGKALFHCCCQVVFSAGWEGLVLIKQRWLSVIGVCCWPSGCGQTHLSDSS